MLKPAIKKLLGTVLRLIFRLRVEGGLPGLDSSPPAHHRQP
jgi:hypothetical protein